MNHTLLIKTVSFPASLTPVFPVFPQFFSFTLLDCFPRLLFLRTTLKCLISSGFQPWFSCLSLYRFPDDFVNWQLPDFHLQIRSLFWNWNHYIKLPTVDVSCACPTGYSNSPKHNIFLNSENGTANNMATKQTCASHLGLFFLHHQHPISFHLLVSST